MAKITVEIPQNVIDEAVKKELKKLLSENSKLRKERDQLKQKIYSMKEDIGKAESIIGYIRDVGEFKGD